MSKKKQTTKQDSIVVSDLADVYNRIMYREKIIPSCQSRRLLQTFVDQHCKDEDLRNLYADFVDVLMHISDSNRRMLLSEIVASWVIQEFGPMAKEARAKAE
ncbi:MAG TPA: hypothetical protein VGO49_03040 [Bradyrhizobium sp.]|jgi:hypothetical protein|nr:hypothetical protein [Bradyrhizobium sp.]